MLHKRAQNQDQHLSLIKSTPDVQWVRTCNEEPFNEYNGRAEDQDVGKEYIVRSEIEDASKEYLHRSQPHEDASKDCK